MPRLENRCKLFLVNTLFRASILDFRPELANRCKVFLVYALFRASILDFRPELANRCMDCPKTASLLQRFLISGPDLRITAAPSSQQCGMARLQRPLRLRWSASDSNFRCGKEEWFRLQRSSLLRCPVSDSNFRSGKEEWFRLQRSLRLRWSASDSNFRCRKGEWSRLRQSLRQRVPASDSNIEQRPDSKKDSRAIPRCPYFIRCHRSTRLKCFDCFLV